MKNHPKPEPKEPGWTIRALIDWCVSYFKTHNIENPRIDTEILLAHALHLKRIDLYLRYDQPINKSELSYFKELIKRRIKREPVAYITGKKEFWSLEFMVTSDTLIPRPDTECLVEEALKHLDQHQSSGPKKILDMGTGTGAVIIALASSRPDNIFFASDNSVKAINVAIKNAAKLHLSENIHFITGDWLAPMKTDTQMFDMIVSNPPYIPTDDIKKLQPEISEFEPIKALDGGDDGLCAVSDIIHTAHEHLNSGGVLLLEIGFDQRGAVQKLIDNSGSYENEIFIKDCAGHDRVIKMKKNDCGS